MNRIVQDWYNSDCWCEDIRGSHKFKKNANFNFKKDLLVQYLIDILERVYKYHIAYKTMLYEWEEMGMFASSNGDYIQIRNLFSTIGINGLNEAAEFLGLEVSNNSEYIQFLQLILGTIKEQNKIHSIRDRKKPFLFNSEVVPKTVGTLNPY